MAKNKINDLRDHLFAAIERLSDPECKLDEEILRSKAIANVAEVVIESAKAETEFLKVTGGDGSGFITYDKLEEQKKLSKG